MSPESIRSMLDRRPFLPFRIHVDEGTSCDVVRPEWCLVCRASVMIGIKRPDSPGEFFDVPVFIANRHITRLEPLVDEVAS
jgi:hypothetical protein